MSLLVCQLIKKKIMSHCVLRSKVLVLGAQTVGKTSFINSFVKDGQNFQPSYTMTLTSELSTKSIVNEEHNVTVEFFIYDISGSSIYEYEYQDVFKDANQIIIVFDITRSATLKECASWLDKVANYSEKSLPGVLVGNKADLSEYSDVTADDCRSFATEHGLNYYEVSAKQGTCVSDPFADLAEKYIQLYENEVDVFVNAD